MSDATENSTDGDSYRVAAGQVLQFVERIERLDEEAKEVSDARKDLMAEAKSSGLDTKMLKKLVALRKRNPDELSEEEAILEIYKEAIGMR